MRARAAYGEKQTQLPTNNEPQNCSASCLGCQKSTTCRSRAVVMVTDSLMHRDCFGEFEGGVGPADFHAQPLADLGSFTAAEDAAVPLSDDVGRVFTRRDQDAPHVCNLFTNTLLNHSIQNPNILANTPNSSKSLPLIMSRLRITEIHESLGFKNHGNPSHRTRAVFHYEPLLRLYKLEIPSLFGRLMRDEGILYDRSNPNLFQTELEELLSGLGPLIWPDPGQGPRDHLLEPVEGSRYPSDLIYPRDKDM